MITVHDIHHAIKMCHLKGELYSVLFYYVQLCLYLESHRAHKQSSQLYSLQSYLMLQHAQIKSVEFAITVPRVTIIFDNALRTSCKLSNKLPSFDPFENRNVCRSFFLLKRIGAKQQLSRFGCIRNTNASA